MISKILFVIGLIAAASSLVSPPLALTMGLVFGLLFVHPFPGHCSRVSRILLQASVVGLGFGMNLQEVLRAGRNAFTYTLFSITFALILGTALGFLFRVEKTSAFL